MFPMPLLWHSFSSKLIICGWDFCTVFQNSPSMYFLSLSLLRSEWSTSVTLSPSPDSCCLHSPVCWRDFPLRLLFGSVSFFFPAFLGFTFLRHFFLYWILFWGLILTYCFILFFVFILLEYILESVEHSYDHSLEFPVGKSFQTVHSYWGPLLWVRHFWRRHVVLVFCVVFVSMLWPVHLKLVESFFFSYFFFFQWRHLQCSGEGYILEVTKSK